MTAVRAVTVFGAQVVAFRCDLDAYSFAEIQRQVEEIGLSVTSRLIVDLPSVPHMTTAGMALLLGLCQQTKGEIVLAHPSQQVRNLLDICRSSKGPFSLIDCLDVEPSIVVKPGTDK
jgi:anti-anti-sigma factor